MLLGPVLPHFGLDQQTSVRRQPSDSVIIFNIEPDSIDVAPVFTVIPTGHLNLLKVLGLF